MIANIPKDNVMDLYHSLGEYMQNEVRLWLTNESLLKSCRSISDDKHLNEYSASLVIIKLLWEKLQNTNVLKIVR
jgi:hypothetical protein